jgi:arabinogalactan oligomer/maltooligosaccharide transport system substrate-binding protein
MKQKISLPVCLLILVALSLSACGELLQGEQATPVLPPTVTYTPTRLPTQTPTPTEFVLHGTVRIWHMWDETQLPALVQIIQNFRALYPDVSFDVLYVPSEDLLERYQSEAREGSGPSLLLGPAEWGPGLFDAGLVADLQTLANQALLGSLNQPALGAAYYKDALIGLPYTIQGVVLFRNKSIITINATTFEELITLAQTSTIGDEIGAYLERSFFYSGAHLNGIGGHLMDENGQPAFNNQKGIQWLELLSEFEQAGPTNFFTDEDLERFESDRIGWIIDGTWNLADMAQAIGPENLAIDVWPSYDDGHLAGYVRAENLYLNPRTADENLLATQRFIEYFLSPEAQAYLADVGLIPAASGVTLTDPINGPLITQAMIALATGVTYPVTPEMAIYNIQMDIALRAYFEGALSAEQALQTAQQAILDSLGQMQAEGTPTP